MEIIPKMMATRKERVMVTNWTKILYAAFSSSYGFEEGGETRGRDVFKLLDIRNKTDLHSDSTKQPE